MSEADAVEQVDDPVTKSSIVSDLRDLGITGGETLLAHSSLRALGWVSGDAPAVVDALREAVTAAGTLVMPTHTPQNSDPSVWSSPPVPDDWVETIRETRPPFRPDATPTRGMGAIPECFRTYPDVVRSDHPIYSFAAWGADAEEIVAGHDLDYSLGEGSPLARVYERGGQVLLLGTDHDTNTSLHLAEYRADYPEETKRVSAPVLRDGERAEVEFEDLVIDSDDFGDLGADFEREVGLTEGSVGAATAKLTEQRELVDFAVGWFEANR